MKEEEEKQNKFGSPKKPDVISNEKEQINIFLSDDVNILKCLIDEVREDNKKYDTIYFDIWPLINKEAFKEMKILSERFSKIKLFHRKIS